MTVMGKLSDWFEVFKNEAEKTILYNSDPDRVGCLFPAIWKWQSPRGPHSLSTARTGIP